ncbi:hypothetical protein LEMLEM_LOCUS11357 [Lemmus lemmus]
MGTGRQTRCWRSNREFYIQIHRQEEEDRDTWGSISVVQVEVFLADGIQTGPVAVSSAS